jgi:hypothetical protein
MSTDPIEPFAAPLRACSDEELLAKLAALPLSPDETTLEDPRARPVLRLWARSTDERISDVAKIALERIERRLR